MPKSSYGILAVASFNIVTREEGDMKKKICFIAATAMLFAFAPMGAVDNQAGGSAPFGVSDACAQTGTCKASIPDICFVNGEAFASREWIPAA